LKKTLHIDLKAEMMNLANPSSYKGMDFFLDDDSLDELDEINFKKPNLIQAPLPTYNTDS